MKVGIMGGTFDPVHNGHLLAAERAWQEAVLDEVWFMPANIPPHKLSRPFTAALDRLRMVELATSDNPHFRVCDYELVRGGTSFTFDTMTELTALHPGITFSYIVGADMLIYLPKWHRVDELAKLVDFIGVGRPGYGFEPEELSPALRERITLVPMPLTEISSTVIRERSRSGLSVRYLIPDAVREYMEVNRLYEH